MPSWLLLGAVGLDAAALEEGARVPLATVRRLFALTARMTGDPLPGLHAAERIEFRGPLAYLFMSCSRLRQGIELYTRFSRIAVDGQRQVLEEDGPIASVLFELDLGTPHDNRHLIDYIMMGSVRTFRRAAGPDFGLLEVRTRHAAGVLREIVEAQLRSPVLSVKEIAASVAFADVATFSKAFRRWTGSSPSTFRARALGRRVVTLSHRRTSAP